MNLMVAFRWVVSVCLGLTLAILVSGCTQTQVATSERPLVVCTTGFVGDLVSQVGGDAVEVRTLIPPGIDPHLYKATPSDVALLQRADLVVYSGLHLEGKMSDVLERLAERKPVVAVAEQIKRPIEASGVPDPHVWMDPYRWSEGVSSVQTALQKLVPSQADAIQKRAISYADELKSAGDELKEIFETIPKNRRVLITAHDAFRYFGEAYDFEVLGIQGLSTETEAGLADINRLVDRIVKDRIPSVFVETSISPRSVEALIEGARSRGATVRMGGTLYSDALGDPGSGAETLISMLRTNAKTIAEGLR